MKIVFVEPNLKDNFGHVYTVMRAIDGYTKKYSGAKYKFFLVSNKNIKESALKSFKKIYPLATVGCFETSDPAITEAYISNIINKFNLTKNDSMIFPTAHFNELTVAGKIARKSDSPRFLLHIHQFYPPAKDSDAVQNHAMFNLNKKIFQKILPDLKKKNIIVATTTSKKLNQTLSTAAKQVLPILNVPVYLKRSSPKKNPQFAFSFLGDGRREKGLHLFIEAVIQLLEEDEKYHFLFHVPNLRYFSEEKLSDIKSRIDYLKTHYKKNLTWVEDKMSSEDYELILRNSRCVVLPYDPRHYDKRISGIAEECGYLGIPVITSEGTAVGEEIVQHKQCGITFAYDTKNETRTVNSLLAAMQDLNKHVSTYKHRATQLKPNFAKRTKIENYISACLKLLK